MELKQITREDWIAALRSGEYKQAQGRMYNEFQDAYCCLGVACKLAGVPLEILSTPQAKSSSFNFLGKEEAKQMYEMLGVHRTPIDRRFGLSSKDYNSTYVLASRNDAGQSFADIADFLEGKRM